MITLIKPSPRSSPPPALLLLVFGVGFGLGACTLPNPNHCQNIAIDANAWCASVDSDRPYCSPCEADNNGCVAKEPDQQDCPAYTVPALETGTGSESSGGSETGTETGSTTG